MGPELWALSGVLLLIGLHPFLTYPASLALLAQFITRPVAAWSELPRGKRVALCVCAYNEEAIIRDKIENMLALKERVPELELLVYVDAATDATSSILRRYADRVHLIVSPERHGKTHGMNALVAATNADFVVFSDANVMFAPDAIERLLLPFGDPEVGCVCGHLIYVGAPGSGTAFAGSVYWRLEEWIKRMESRTGSTMGADGSIFAIRRPLHRPPPPDIIDDMFVSLSILCEGHRVVKTGDALAYEEVVSKPGEEFRRKVRISCQAFNVHRLLLTRLRRLSLLDRYKYISHKSLRWMTVYFLTAGIAALVAGLAVAAAWSVLAGLFAVAMLGVLAGMIFPASPAGKALDIAAAFVATGFGVLRSLRGDRFQTWTPAASAHAVPTGFQATAQLRSRLDESRP
jgi:cellulose synthase/poly-beta-1,6-N-acetylglucosamine synthase-like glycosyltransferase